MRALARAVVAREGVLVIAHRGASAEAPENTLHAFRRGIDAGADLIELDYRHAKDGRPHVCHDATLDRTTDAVRHWGASKHAIAERTSGELRALDAGGWFHPTFRGATLPSLAEALRVIQDGGMALIERKTGDAQTLAKLLVDRGLVERVVVQAFDWRFLAACRKELPGLSLGALGSKELTPERLAQIGQTGAGVVGWNHEYVDARCVARVHGKGLKLWVYTVDDPARALALRALGVDGIITNRPAAIRKALDAAAGEQR